VLFRRDGKLRELQVSIIRLAARRALRQMILSHEDRPFALRYKFHRMMFVWRLSDSRARRALVLKLTESPFMAYAPPVAA
jgi:hypothetical protein